MRQNGYKDALTESWNACVDKMINKICEGKNYGKKKAALTDSTSVEFENPNLRTVKINHYIRT